MLDRAASKLLIGLVQVYRICLRPLLGPRCRYHPSCSAYAIEALQVHGAVRGAALAAKRLTRCHPGHTGGFDPVPESRPKTP